MCPCGGLGGLFLALAVAVGRLDILVAAVVDVAVGVAVAVVVAVLPVVVGRGLRLH